MLNELFSQEGQSIFSFKRGDIIIMTKKAEIKGKMYNDNLGIEVEVTTRTDGSFRTTPVEFIAVENDVIYLRELKGQIKDRIVYKVAVEDFGENWILFKIPEGLTLEDCI